MLSSRWHRDALLSPRLRVRVRLDLGIGSGLGLGSSVTRLRGNPLHVVDVEAVRGLYVLEGAAPPCKG